ncbi:MAG: MBL fold metallo-hydrolase [Proteobacteria bacterium]|nr:MBL fold metallo-hydrolase [Pseudomonadota bacterium]
MTSIRGNVLVCLFNWALFFLFTTSTAFAGDDRAVVKVCHIANAGFYISDGENGVLIDGILGQPYGFYQHPSEAINEAIETSSGPFSDVNLVLISHFHGDHFDALATLRHIRNNSKALYVMPPQTFALLEEAGLNKEEKSRVYVHKLNEGEWLALPEIPNIKLVGIRHAKNASIENFGYLVEIGGKSIFHPGDIGEEAGVLEAIEAEEPLLFDVLLMPVWFLLKPEDVKRVDQIFDQKYTVPMHMLEDKVGQTQGWPAQYGGWEAVKKTVASAFPGTVELFGEMDCFEID